MKGVVVTVVGGVRLSSLIVGFIAAFIFGCLACRWMVDIVKRGKLIYFAVYCAVVGLGVIIFSIL